MPSTTASKLDGLSQAVHLDHLRPAAKLFLHSTVNTDDDGDDQWIIRVYADVDESTAVWSGNVKWERISSQQVALADAIANGMLHVDLQGRKRLDVENGIEIHFLDPSGQALRKLLLSPESDQKTSNHLLQACFSLLARPQATKSDKSELRNLHAEVKKKEEEISHLQTKLSSLKATVVRATASDNNRKKVQASPKKPANASALQPNTKRRKAVEDEFAGSDSD